MCSNAPFLTRISESQSIGYTFRPDCNKWSCHECRPTLEAAWNYHAGTLFDTCPDGIGYLCVPEDKLATTLKRFARAGTQYIRVRGHGVFHIYASNKTLGKYSLPREAAVALFAEHISLAPSGEGHVISTSRAWRKSKTRTPAQTGESDAVCVAIGVSPDVVKTLLDALSIQFTQSAEVLSFQFDKAQSMAEFLKAIKTAPRECPSSSINTKKNTTKFSDKPRPAAKQEHPLTRNPAFDRLRTGCLQQV